MTNYPMRIKIPFYVHATVMRIDVTRESKG